MHRAAGSEEEPHRRSSAKLPPEGLSDSTATRCLDEHRSSHFPTDSEREEKSPVTRRRKFSSRTCSSSRLESPVVTVCRFPISQQETPPLGARTDVISSKVVPPPLVVQRPSTATSFYVPQMGRRDRLTPINRRREERARGRGAPEETPDDFYFFLNKPPTEISVRPPKRRPPDRRLAVCCLVGSGRSKVKSIPERSGTEQSRAVLWQKEAASSISKGRPGSPSPHPGILRWPVLLLKGNVPAEERNEGALV